MSVLLSRRELAFRAIEGLFRGHSYFALAVRNREMLLEECNDFPFALLNDGGESNPDQQTQQLLLRAELEIDVGVKAAYRDEVVSELNRARAEAFDALMGGWQASDAAGTLLANVEYRGCAAPMLAVDGSARGAMTLLFAMTYVQHELDAYAAG